MIPELAGTATRALAVGLPHVEAVGQLAEAVGDRDVVSGRGGDAASRSGEPGRGDATRSRPPRRGRTRRTDYGLTAAGADGVGAGPVVTGAAGVALLAAFVINERRSPHPMMPPSMFGDPSFTTANVVTFLVYGALGMFFFLVVLQLQTVAGFAPLVAGSALLPVTALMLLLSARAGALAERTGPRLLMTIGPLLAAAGFLLALRIGRDSSYLFDVLPATIVLGLGLSATVAPLTSTVLGAADRRLTGPASGVNNAVARTAGLLAVAVIPAAAGISGDDYTSASGFDDGFDIAMIAGSALLVGAALLSALLIREPLGEPEVAVDRMTCCPVSAPQLHPTQRPRTPDTHRAHHT